MKQTNYSYTDTRAASYNEGLRSYMTYVYNYMAAALLLTGLVAMVTASSSLVNMMFTPNGITGLGMIITLAPLGIVLTMSFGLNKIKLSTMQLLFWSYAALVGMSLSSLLLVYKGESIARVFFITASVFGAMSIYGYTTKKDLTGLGSYMMMGLIGVIIASVVNIFMHSSGLSFVLSIVSVLLFVGLTAYDTQKIKSLYYQASEMEPEMAKKVAIMGAFTLYMDFINLFILLLRFFGDRRSN